MNAKKLNSPAPKLLKRQQAEERYNMSWNTLVKAAREAGALVHYMYTRACDFCPFVHDGK